MTLNILFIYDQSLSFYLEGMNFSLIQVLTFIENPKSTNSSFFFQDGCLVCVLSKPWAGNIAAYELKLLGSV